LEVPYVPTATLAPALALQIRPLGPTCNFFFQVVNVQRALDPQNSAQRPVTPINISWII